VPYDGPDAAMAPVMLAPQYDVQMGYAPDAGVLIGVVGANDVSEAPVAAPNVNPYDTAAINPIYTGGDHNPGGYDDVAATVAGSVAAAQARFLNHEADTHAQGSVIGDLMTFPEDTATGAPLDPGTSPGIATPAGGYYDPPRDYDGMP